MSARNASASERSGVTRGRSPPFRKFWLASAGQLKICNACCPAGPALVATAADQHQVNDGLVAHEDPASPHPFSTFRYANMTLPAYRRGPFSCRSCCSATAKVLRDGRRCTWRAGRRLSTPPLAISLTAPISPVCAGLLTGPAVCLWLEDGGVTLAEPIAAFGERCAVGSARGGAPRSENQQTWPFTFTGSHVFAIRSHVP